MGVQILGRQQVAGATVTVADYYDGCRDSFVTGYEIRNPRVVMALAFANKHLHSARTVVDVGCGIGWTTHELDAPAVIGLDISPVLTAAARTMFPHRRFVTTDFADWEPESVDAVVMIDVYEHFSDRPAVHRKIRATGATTVVLAVPTPEAMRYARDNGIELQPIDRDVTGQDIAMLAGDIGGRVEVNELVSIWMPHDYRHVLITC